MDTQTISTPDQVDKVCAAAVRAGKAAMAFYKTESLDVQQKTDNSPVTQADLAANAVLIEDLSAFGFPILSEETSDTEERQSHDRVWIIDPIDGTRDFIQQTGEFCVMVGLSEFGHTTFGVVYMPATDTLYYGGVGIGAWVIEHGVKKELHISTRKDAEEVILVTSKSHPLPAYNQVADFLKVQTQVMVSSNGLKCAMVAAGNADIFFTFTSKLGEWDMCGPHAIVEAAGGRVTGLDGTPLLYNKKQPYVHQGVLVTNGFLHDQILSYMHENHITAS